MQAKEIEQDMLRNDLQRSLSQSHIDPSALSTFQRIILTTDGTLTDILEAYIFEQIRVIKLSETLSPSSEDIEVLELTKNTDIIDRKVLLQGKISRKNFIYAESIIIPERLDEKFREELLKSKTPIGRLWLEYKMETFKEIIDSKKRMAGDLAPHFNLQPEDYLFSRTYRVFSGRRPALMISEMFPESYFL
jgi:chorismate-pyruvate lyase